MCWETGSARGLTWESRVESAGAGAGPGRGLGCPLCLFAATTPPFIHLPGAERVGMLGNHPLAFGRKIPKN